MVSAQDKILYVANKLGLSTLQDMQGSTGAIYDTDINGSGILFGNSAQHLSPDYTNINDNKFEVNEALLVETISFYQSVYDDENQRYVQEDLYQAYGSSAVVVFDLVIGNKVVMKDVPVFAAGSPLTFASSGFRFNQGINGLVPVLKTRHQVYMEGAGILIPPQVDFFVQYRVFDFNSGELLQPINMGCYLFGTSVLLNFNTSI